jgi:hypothetical protein
MNNTKSRSDLHHNNMGKDTEPSSKKRHLAGWVKIVLLLLILITIVSLYALFIGSKGLEIN